MNDEQLKEYKNLCKKKNGRVTSHELYEFAKDEATALHDYFEWNEAKAAYHHNIKRADDFIRQARFHVESPEGLGDEITAVYSVKENDDDEDREFVSLGIVKRTPKLRRQKLAEDLKRAIYWIEMYIKHVGMFGERAGIGVDVRKLKAKLSKLEEDN